MTQILIAPAFSHVLCDRFNLLEGTSKFSCRMIEPGIISYLNTPEKDVVLIRKETIDRCIASIIGNPVTVEHIDIAEEPALEDVSNGSVQSWRYNAVDGWYYADGILETDTARNLIRRGHRPSCAFSEKKVAINTTGLRYHGFHYDKEITELEFHHLAIVKRPRFEEAIFRLNSINAMNPVFTLLRKIFTTRKNDAGAEVKEESVEKIELDGNTEVTIGEGDKAKKIRLNDLGTVYLAHESGVIADAQKIAIPVYEGLPAAETTVGELVKLANVTRKNTADALAKKEADEKEVARLNQLEADRKAGFHLTLKTAEEKSGKISTQAGYSTSSGSLAEKIAEGKKRY